MKRAPSHTGGSALISQPPTPDRALSVVNITLLLNKDRGNPTESNLTTQPLLGLELTSTQHLCPPSSLPRALVSRILALVAALSLMGLEVLFLSSASPRDLFGGRTHTKFATQQ